MTVDSFRLDLPMAWKQTPVEPDDFRRHVLGTFTEEDWRSVPLVERRRTELFIERVVADLRTTDARFAAALMEKVPDSEEGTGDGGFVIAGVTMSMMHRDQLKSPVALSIEVVHAAMSRTDPAPANAKWSRARTTNLEPPSIVALPVGRVVRLVRLVEQGDASTKSEYFTESFLVPVPEEFEYLLVVQFATPHVRDARLFSELFGAIAQTVKTYRTDEPTTL